MKGSRHPGLQRPLRPLAQLAAVFSTVGFSFTVQAQSLSSSGLTFGGFERKIEIDLAADGTYDSNVARVRPDSADTRGLEKDDFILRPRVEGLVAVPAGPVELSLTGLAGFNIYTQNSELNSERIDLNANAAVNVRPCGVSVVGGYSRAQSDLRDLSIEPGDSEASSVNVRTVKRVRATAYCGATIGLRASAVIGYRKSDNSNFRRRGSSFDEFTYGGGIIYSNPIVGEITVFVERSRYEYQAPDPVLQQVFPSFTVLQGGLRVDRRLGARLQLNGEVAYTKVDVAGVSGEQRKSLNWDIAASLRATDRLRLTLGASRNVDASPGFKSDFETSTSYAADIAYAMTERLRLSLAGTHQKRRFAKFQIVAPTTPTQDEFNRVSGNLSFQRFRRLTFTLFASYEERVSDLDVYRYDGFTSGFGVRLRL